MAYHAHSTSMASFPLTAAADFAVRQSRQPSLLRRDIAEIQAADPDTNSAIEKAAGVAPLEHGVEAHFGEVGEVIDFDVQSSRRYMRRSSSACRYLLKRA